MGILMIGMRGKISTETQIFFLVSLMFYANNIKEMLLWSFCSFHPLFCVSNLRGEISFKETSSLRRYAQINCCVCFTTWTMFTIEHSNTILITISLWRSVSEKIENGTHMLFKIFQLIFHLI